ncbi:hypothetical protein GH714_009032 [Hevea brasiliensis]|uniref:HAT C-terminal dimerisation domain-containing protein n=1 Tax=Hevea brasiliensis TaxID=3981 RepID=A0A6A6KME3_HEVBR|nr:hypothetical protein GH714_009032 [Hevea brasiliensis]
MFRLELGENGVSDFHDWSECRKMAEMLSHFYELTLRISGSRYVTSNMFFGEISDLAFILNQWVDNMILSITTRSKSWKKNGGLDSKTELEVYLNEAIQEDKEDFDLLNGGKSILRDFLSWKNGKRHIGSPVSTVASESAFRTGGRVLDPFRSSLTPRIVEALICAQDWIRSSNCPINVEEDLEELEKLEDGFQKLLPPYLRMFLDLVGLLKIKLLEI